MSHKKALLIPVSLAMHTKLKWRAAGENRSMASIVRELIDQYLGGERALPEPEPDFYEELYEKVSRAVDG